MGRVEDILNYIIYYQKEGSEPKTGKVLASQTSYEISGLEPNESYEFWVTASNNIGEGPNSVYITKKTSKNIAPQIVNYGEQFRVQYKKAATLPCDTIGYPQPKITWKVSLIDFAKIVKTRV